MKNKKLIDRVKYPNSLYSYCRVIGCKEAVSAATEEGLNQRFCRKHEDFYERHGSYYKSSYTAPQLKPYIKAASKWLSVNQKLPTVQRARLKVECLYRHAGLHIEAFRLRGLSPSDRAKAAWARLRVAKVDPMKPLAAYIAIELISRADSQAEIKPHFKRVQAAKLIHRMASGTHKRWEQEGPRGEIKVTELHAYPRSRGKVLVYIGEQIELASELIVSHYLTQIEAPKASLRLP